MSGAIRVGVIAEGDIDHALLTPLLSAIARDRACLTWPVNSEDISTYIPIRKTGHGGVLKKVERLVTVLKSPQFAGDSFELLVVLIDGRKTKAVRDKLRKLTQGDSCFVLGVAIEEMEAWWLGDRSSILKWLQIDEAPSGTRYGQSKYRAEKDDLPKATVDELTRISNAVDEYYGRKGNVSLARAFADQWQPQLASIEHQCPEGFGRFCKKAANAFRRAKGRSGRLF